MGKIKGNSVIKDFRGNIGQDMYVRKSGRSTIISRKGVIQRSTKNQEANRQRFAQATLHARGVLVEPELSRLYKIIGLLQGINAKSAAISDFLSHPEIDSVQTMHYNGNIGDTLFIHDKHILKLVNVEVTITALDGTLIERGNAVHWELHWKYCATVKNVASGGTRITVTGFDRLKRKAEKIVYVEG